MYDPRNLLPFTTTMVDNGITIDPNSSMFEDED